MLMLLVFVARVTVGQVQRYPADVQPIVAPPYTVFLSDYTAEGSDRLKANIIFNDFNEASWTFKLRLTIESAEVRLRTKNGFTPATPITVQPGVPYTFSGADWYSYFRFENLDVSGRNVNAIINSGRLPEGMYSFCVQVLDYATGEVLSQSICRNVWIQLLDPPRMITPTCGQYIDPSSATAMNFTWQLFNTVSANNDRGTEYQLTLWEITEPGTNPLSAVRNGQALQVFQSAPLANTSYTYGPADPLLEAGKTYVYAVRARDLDGSDRYKNEGLSEFCYFHYGWPTGGSIEQISPASGYGFKRRDVAALQWSAPNNKLPDQPVSYEVVVKEFSDNENPEDAMTGNPAWYYRMTTPFTYGFTNGERLPFPAIDKGYVWQIKAFSHGTEVARSNLSVFYGPPIVERFYASRHRIEVDKITSKDFNSFSGSGRIRLSEQEVWTKIEFSGLQLQDFGGIVYLMGGEISVDIPPIVFPLTARYEADGEASYLASKYKINRNGLFVEGVVSWQLPFPLASTGGRGVVSATIASSFNDFKLTGQGPLAKDYAFDLLDPASFSLGLAKTSIIHISNGVFWFDFNGTVTVASVKSTDGKPAVWSFSQAEHLRYMQVSAPISAAPLQVVAGTGLSLLPAESIIDLDDQASPGRFSGLPTWKGIYINQASLSVPATLDESGQFALSETFESPIATDPEGASFAAISGRGLSLEHSLVFDQPGSFNTFPATFSRLVLHITDQQVQEKSRIEGSFLIPFVDTATPLGFEAQLYSQGFRPGVLGNLPGKAFRFNPNGGELAVDLVIRKGQMANNDHLQLTMDITWPSLGVTLKGVNHFNVWGDYSVGFHKPEGIAALSSQVSATFRGYPVTIDAISAGRSGQYYGLAVSGKVVMGEDVSGDDGAPAFNLYSMALNPLLTPDYTPAPTQGTFNLAEAQNGLDELEAELAALGEDLNQKVEEETANLAGTTADLVAAAATDLGGMEYGADDLLPAEPVEEEGVEGVSPKERLIAYLEALRDIAEDPSALDSMIDQIRESEEDFDDIDDVIAEIKRFATNFAVDKVASLGDGFLMKVDGVTNKINNTVVQKVADVTTPVYQQIDMAVGNVINSVSAGVIASLAQDAPDAALVVEQVANSTREAIVNELVISLNSSVNQNVVFPITSFVRSNLSERAHRLVRQTAERVVLGALSRDQDPDEVLREVINGIDDELNGLGEELAGQLDMNKITDAIKALAADAVANVSAQRIASNIKQGALNAVAGALAKKGTEALAALSNNLLGDQIGISIPVDFGAAGARLLSGASPRELLFDPIPIKVRSPSLDLNGLLRFVKDHPMYGDMWGGDVTAYVKVPRPFEIQLAYMNGRKDGVSFWMAEVGSPASAPTASGGQQTDFSQVGRHTGHPVKEIVNEIELGAVKIVALKGRVYHHMVSDDLEGVTPDGSNRYGAFMHMVGFGPQNGRMLRMEINARMDVATSGDFTVDFAGNAQMLSKNPQVLVIDQTAVIQGAVTLSYNSAERHFLGYVAATLQQPGVLCAEGNLLVDVKPGAWQVALGNQQERIAFILNCAGFGPTGWLNLNQNTANLGLGLAFMFRPDPINLNVGVAKVGLLIDAGAAAGIQTTIQYNPNFALLEAGLWLELWADILLQYETAMKKGSINLVSIYLAADANMHFNPAPTYLYGKARGQVRVLFLDFGFNKDFRMNM